MSSAPPCSSAPPDGAGADSAPSPGYLSSVGSLEGDSKSQGYLVTRGLSARSSRQSLRRRKGV